jgi:hypothetical protein
MESLVRQLQRDALDSKVAVSDLLRKAKVVAIKLDLGEFLFWVEKELNGYGTTEGELPPYRLIKGETKGWNPYHGWVPVIFSDIESQNLLVRRGVNQPVGELDDLMRSSDKGTFQIDFNPEAKNAIMEAVQMQTDIKFMLGRSAIAGILEAVRNTILDWSLKLEKEGILGEGLSFSKEEHEKAQNTHTNYTIGNIEHFAGSIGNLGNSSKVEVKQVNAGSKDDVVQLLKQIRQYSPEVGLADVDRNKLNDDLAKLEIELQNEHAEPGTIKRLLASLKNIFEGASGNVIAQGIIVAIQRLLLGA